jgi:hypothetical protein
VIERVEPAGQGKTALYETFHATTLIPKKEKRKEYHPLTSRREREKNENENCTNRHCVIEKVF